MTERPGYRRLFRIGRGAKSAAAEVDEELRFHIESRMGELMSRGMTLEEARSRALQEFGDLSDTERILTASRRRLFSRRARADWRSDLVLDSRIAWRGLTHRPGLALALLLILGLASGACGAIFTVVRAALVQAMPYPDAGRLVHLRESTGQGGSSEASWPDLLDWKTQAAESFSGLEAYDPANVFVSDGGGTRMIHAARVTSGFFDLLKIRIALGRGFRPGEDQPGGSTVVLLSDGYWRQHFGGDPSVLNRSVTINGRPHTVIGVAPAGFHFAPAGDAALWLPIDQDADTRAERFNHWVNVLGRLSDGATLATARASLDLVMQRLAAAYPETNRGRGIVLVPLREVITGDLRPVLFALTLAVLLVLVIACANAAGLFLSRTLGRGRELAVRLAIGATRGRIIRQLVTESLLVGVGGALVGILIARAGVAYLFGGLTESALDHLPFFRGLSPDGFTLAFLALLAVVTGLGSGLAPALLGARSDTTNPVAGSARSTTGRSGRRLRDGLVIGQLALTVTLLTGTALVGRSLISLLAEDLGFQAEPVVTGRVALSGPAWSENSRRQRFFENLLEQVRAMPGVSAVGAVSNLPLNGGGTNTFRIEGEPEPDVASRPEATMRAVAGDYFQAMGIPLVAGRLFTERDDSTAQGVVLISRSFARLFPGDPVGRRLRFYAFPDTTWEIAGVVGDVRPGRIDGDSPPVIYYTHLQAAENRMTLSVRTSGEAGPILSAVRTELGRMGPDVALYAESTMQDVVRNSPAVVARRYPLRVIGAFAAVALLLAVAGIYGVVSNGVAERRRELGIRSALGARAGQLVGLILRRGAVIILLGVVAGSGFALVFSRTVSALLYGVPPNDPITLLTVILVLAGTALLASWWPARRAGQVNPVEVLNQE